MTVRYFVKGVVSKLTYDVFKSTLVKTGGPAIVIFVTM